MCERVGCLDAVRRAALRRANDETAVAFDMITLFFEKLETLKKDSPLAQRLREQIDLWVEQQPTNNRGYWQDRLAELDAGGG